MKFREELAQHCFSNAKIMGSIPRMLMCKLKCQPWYKCERIELKTEHKLLCVKFHSPIFVLFSKTFTNCGQPNTRNNS